MTATLATISRRLLPTPVSLGWWALHTVVYEVLEIKFTWRWRHMPLSLIILSLSLSCPGSLDARTPAPLRFTPPAHRGLHITQDRHALRPCNLLAHKMLSQSVCHKNTTAALAQISQPMQLHTYTCASPPSRTPAGVPAPPLPRCNYSQAPSTVAARPH